MSHPMWRHSFQFTIAWDSATVLKSVIVIWSFSSCLPLPTAIALHSIVVNRLQPPLAAAKKRNKDVTTAAMPFCKHFNFCVW